MIDSDTIAAVATAPGRGGVGIVRISGSHSKQIAQQILGTDLPDRKACYLPFTNQKNEILDHGIAIFFKGPKSFTGEDVLELQGHGGPVVLDLLLKQACLAGARLAKPGEFSERAFLNNKMDLSQAEAIADLIDASSEQAARSAMLTLTGEFSAEINKLLEKLINLRLFIEAAIDFPEEEIDFISEGKVEQKLFAVEKQLALIMEKAKQGAILRKGVQVVIAGKPNAGKSSLLNRLAGKDSAIVTDIPGTTRDVVREVILIDDIPLHVIDTAGLREGENEVEQIGIEKAWSEINSADILLLLIDGSVNKNRDVDRIWSELTLHTMPRIPVVLVINKLDLSHPPSSEKPAETTAKNQFKIHLSAKTGEGLSSLKQLIKQLIGFNETGETGYMARRRHLEALEKTQQHLQQGKQQLLRYQAAELLAEELLLAQNHLSEITGEFTSDDLLGEIFSSFCIGK